MNKKQKQVAIKIQGIIDEALSEFGYMDISNGKTWAISGEVPDGQTAVYRTSFAVAEKLSDSEGEHIIARIRDNLASEFRNDSVSITSDSVPESFVHIAGMFTGDIVFAVQNKNTESLQTALAEALKENRVKAFWSLTSDATVYGKKVISLSMKVIFNAVPSWKKADYYEFVDDVGDSLKDTTVVVGSVAESDEETVVVAVTIYPLPR